MGRELQVDLLFMKNYVPNFLTLTLLAPKTF